MQQIEQFSTFQIQPQKRLAFWNSLCDSTLSGTRIDSASAGFRAEMLRWNVGPLVLLRPRSDASRVQRKQNCAQSSQRLILHFLNRGVGGIKHQGGEAVLHTGNFVISSPYIGYDLSLSQDHELLVVEMPLEPLRHRLAGLEEVLEKPIPSAISAKILQEFLLSMWRHGEYAESLPGWAEEVTEVFFDLLAMAMRYSDGSAATLSQDTQRQSLRRAKTFVANNFTDPSLNTQSIAEYLHVSVRTVQHLFSLESTTPSAYILESRLSRAADRLKTEPTLSVTQIAYDMGFQDSAYFSRCFRRQFGVAPRDWRKGA
ncbi:hypothetical protein PAEH1_08990 [Paenalcaligenes hominis]|uniref:HTH araC/xylS-type domain-containing protein n=1 Tax=Paenalcaligenes hominis TaxID=643674 RepID=A0A1U9K0U4_9BURK|nr:AraC family transcriptional regulator [Paenalcaligenes hominis]AQS51660.1 hypothetical protein PAEH1_08990 [Paenalcaligenes hominis]